MKYSEYFEEHQAENFSWCKPYMDKTETYYVVMHDGEMLGIVTPTTVAYRYDGTLTDDLLERVAKEINPDFDSYSGWDLTHIILEAMNEVGCFHCPFKEDCEPYNEYMGETDNR